MGGQKRIRTMEERFWARVNKDGPVREGINYEGLGPCWVFQGGATISYPRAHLSGWAKTLVWRYSYEIHHGPIPEGMVVRHRCDNGHLHCVNPTHLLLGTQQQNVWDRYSRRELPMLEIVAPEQVCAAYLINQKYRVPQELIAAALRVLPATIYNLFATLQERIEAGELTPLERTILADRPRLLPLETTPEEMRQRLENHRTPPPAKRLTEEQLAQAITLHGQGKSVGAIAKALRVSWVTAERSLREAGVELQIKSPTKLTEEQFQEAKALIDGGLSVLAAARALKLPNDNLLRRRLKKEKGTEGA